MPAILAFLALLSAAAFWMYRMRGAADAASELMDVANDVRLAARRFGFRKRNNVHPVESIDDVNVAIATLGVAYLELDGLPTREGQIALGRGLQNELGASLSDAEELVVLGRWLMTECGGAEQAITRVSRKLFKMDQGASFTPLLGIIKEITAEGGASVSPNQTSALEDIKRAFRIT